MKRGIEMAKNKKMKKTVYEVFLADGMKLPDGSNSRIVMTYADAIKLTTSHRKAIGKKKKGKRRKIVCLWEKIVPISIHDVNDRVNERMQSVIAEAKEKAKKEGSSEIVLDSP